MQTRSHAAGGPGGGPSLSSHKEDHRGQIQRHRRLDSRARPEGAPVSPSTGREALQGSKKGAKGVGRTLLCSDGSPPRADWPGPERQVLGVRQRRETDTLSPFHPVQTVVPRDSKVVAEGLRVGVPQGPLRSPPLQRCACDAGDTGVFGGHEGGKNARAGSLWSAGGGVRAGRGKACGSRGGGVRQ